MRLEKVGVTDKSQQCGPVALYFPNHHQPEGNAEWELQRSAGRGIGQSYVIGRSEHVDFVGHALGNTAEFGPCRYAVGVIDKAKGTVRYAPVEHGQIFRVEPKAHSIDFKSNDAGALEEKLDREQGYAQNRRLVEAFGSTRRKRQLNSRQAAAVKEEGVGGAETLRNLLQTAGDAATEAGVTRKELLERALGQKRLPPHHAMATSPEAAYRLDELVPAELNSVSVNEPLPTLLPPSDPKDAVDEYFGLCHFSQADLDTAAAVRRKRSVVYLHGLIRARRINKLTINMSRGGIQEAATKHGIQEIVLSAVLDTFYTEEAKGSRTDYSRTDAQSQLMSMYTLMIALACNGYSMGATTCDYLRAALKITPAQFAELYREMGCVVKMSTRKSNGVSSPGKDIGVVLLPPSVPPKTLAEHFPAIKTPGKRAR